MLEEVAVEGGEACSNVKGDCRNGLWTIIATRKLSKIGLARLNFSPISRSAAAVELARATFRLGYILDGAVVGQHWWRVFFRGRLQGRSMVLRLVVHNEIIEQIGSLLEQHFCM